MALYSEDSDQKEDAPKGWSIGQLLVSFPTRLTFYGVLTIGLFQLVYYKLSQVGPEFVGAENGPVEMAQVYLAIFASCCLFYAATKIRRGRAGLIVCAAMVAYAAARESDTIFEAMLFDDAYKYLVGLPMLLIALAALVIDRRRIVPDAMWLVRQPAIALFAFAGIYLCGVCQVFDRPEMWSSITDPAEAETIKATVEEFAELFAYLMLAFSGIESLALVHRLDVDTRIRTVSSSANSTRKANPQQQRRRAA